MIREVVVDLESDLADIVEMTTGEEEWREILAMFLRYSFCYLSMGPKCFLSGYEGEEGGS